MPDQLSLLMHTFEHSGVYLTDTLPGSSFVNDIWSLPFLNALSVAPVMLTVLSSLSDTSVERALDGTHASRLCE